MQKNNVHNIKKIPDKLALLCIKLISKFHHPIYMRLYLGYLRSHGLDVKGTPIYIGASTSFDGQDFSRIHIGDKTVISSDVRFLTHDYSVSRAIEATGRKLEKEVYFVKDIYVGNNCFIGTKALLLPGTILGDNVIVGAGSVVRGKIEDDSIVIGNPAIIVANTKLWAEEKFRRGDFFSNI